MPPETSNLKTTNSEMIDAQLTTEIFGLYSPFIQMLVFQWHTYQLELLLERMLLGFLNFISLCILWLYLKPTIKT